MGLPPIPARGLLRTSSEPAVPLLGPFLGPFPRGFGDRSAGRHRSDGDRSPGGRLVGDPVVGDPAFHEPFLGPLVRVPLVHVPLIRVPLVHVPWVRTIRGGRGTVSVPRRPGRAGDLGGPGPVGRPARAGQHEAEAEEQCECQPGEEDPQTVQHHQIVAHNGHLVLRPAGEVVGDQQAGEGPGHSDQEESEQQHDGVLSVRPPQHPIPSGESRLPGSDRT